MRRPTLSLLLALAAAAGAAASLLPREQRKATISFVRSLQNADGGFRPAPAPGPSSVSATTAALRALKYQEGPKEPRAAAARFVEAMVQPDGGIPDTAGSKPDARTTSQGLMALVEARSPVRKDASGRIRAFLAENARTLPDIYIAAAALEAAGLKPVRASDWIAAYAATRGPDGVYGKSPSDHAGAVITLLRLGAKVEDRKAAARYLVNAQNPDGGWSASGLNSDLPTTYRAMRALHLLGTDPGLQRVSAFVQSCRNSDGGYGARPGEPSATAPTYFASIVLHWVEEMAGPRRGVLERGGAYTGFPRVTPPPRIPR